ncbi:acyltransferase [Citrobacter freundii]|nr:acyltransferase [Citrobacter freundii]
MSSDITEKCDDAKIKINLGYLDGLRGILCMLVLIEHCINIYKPDIRFTDLDGVAGLIRRVINFTPLNVIYNGDMAVYIFFVLSGFVLSLSFNKTKNHEVILSGVIKRYPRIMLPVAGSMIFMYVAMQLTDNFIGKAFDAQWSEFLVQTLYRVPFTHTVLTNYPLWSMSYELFGSLLVFSLLAIFGKNKYRIIFYFLVMIYFFVSLNQAHQDLYEYSTYYALFVFGVIMCDITKCGSFRINPTIRFIIFLIGLLLATTPLPRVGVGQYIGAYSYLSFFDHFTYMQVSITTGSIGSMLLFASIIDSRLAISLLSTRIVKFLGKISFPLYLNHATVIYVIGFIIQQRYGDVSASEFMIATALTALISILVAYVFERYVDMPSIKVSHKLSKIICK